ncbi:MAG: acetyl-CoA hydrolase/transferase family protein [Gemmatimonadales bacterium]|nr:acetyl-CoA hydrolase/transferase family protein [Gemmatimonadales bacterium]
MDIAASYREKKLADQGVGLLADDTVIYVNGASSLPNRFLQMLSSRADRHRGIRLYHPMRREVLNLDPDPCDARLADHLFHVSDFTYDETIRRAIHEGRASYRPCHASDGGKRFPHDIDLLVAGATPMDAHGFFNLGAFGGWILDFLPRARRIVLEVNESQPHVYGDNYIHISKVDGLIEGSYPIVELPQSAGEATEVERRIASHVVDLIEDGSTLQVGAGTLPEAIVRQLVSAGVRDLGVHTEAYFDWVAPLFEAGIITNARKSIDRGKMIAAMAIGSSALYRFIDRNPAVAVRAFSYVNDPRTIAQGHKPVSINATLQVDLQGQCASEGFGPLHHGGIGGQWNFHYGASLSDQGRAIMALPSTARGGSISRIVPTLPAGTAVSIPRNDIHWVVTEFGAVELRGKALDERARLLISVAHPSFREELERAAREQLRVLR